MNRDEFLDRLTKIGATSEGLKDNEYRFDLAQVYDGADIEVYVALVNDQPLLHIALQGSRVIMYYYGRTNDYDQAWEYCLRLLASRSAAEVDLIAGELERRKINYAQWRA